MFRALPSVLVSEIVCAVIVGALATATTVTADGLTLSSAVLLTLSVTAMVTGGFAEPGDEMLTVPVQVCGVLNPLTFTLTAICVCWLGCVAVIPEAGDAFKNPLQFVLLVVTRNGSGGPVLVRVTI